ncbi:hypothetical protein AKJ16_DCAP00673 [Drosera capensis]
MEEEIGSPSASKDSGMSTTCFSHTCSDCGADFSFLYEKKSKKKTKKSNTRKRTRNADDHDRGDNTDSDSDDVEEEEMDPELKRQLDEFFDRFEKSEIMAKLMRTSETVCVHLVLVGPCHDAKNLVMQNSWRSIRRYQLV